MQQTSQDLVSVGGMPSTSRVFAFNQALALGQPIELDLSQYSNQNRLANVQGAFLDNSAGAAPFVFSCGGGQSISVPAGYQGFFPVYWNATYICKLSGSGVVNITLVNFPTPAAVWNAGGAQAVQSTQDVNLAQSMQNGLVRAIPQFLGSDGTYRGKRLADAFYMGMIKDTNPVTLFGGNSNGFMLASLSIALSFGFTSKDTIEVVLTANGSTIYSIGIPFRANQAAETLAPIYSVSDLQIVGAGPLIATLASSPSSGSLVVCATGGNITT